MELSQLTSHWSIPPFNNWNIQIFTQIGLCIFMWLWQCHLELGKTKRPSCLHIGYFSSSKSFNHIAKDVSVLHLKSSNSHKLNYFPIFTLLGHTSHHHIWPIANNRFLTWKNSANLLQEVGFWHGELLPFSYSFVHFPNLQCVYW
jgi:hypothetical protein